MSDSTETPETSIQPTSINCFEWQNRSSDHLDGTLIGPARRLADEHLEGCEACNQRHQRYITLLTTLSALPRSSVPIQLRHAPLAFNLPRLDIRNTRSRWQQTPWFIRTGVEGLSLACLTLLVISMVPKMRALYERGIERKLEAFNLQDDSEFITDDSGNPVPLVRGKIIDFAANQSTPGSNSIAQTDTAHDDFASEGDSHGEALPDSGKDPGTELRVGNSEIWRFNVKTDSPHLIRAQVVKTLIGLKIPADTPGAGGIEAPGGIQFDLLVSKSVIAQLKTQLQKIAAAGHTPTQGGAKVAFVANDSPLNQAFTWYKNKSKREIPKGKARVVIWLSQM